MNKTMSDDLAYVREIAEAGASAPLLGGRFLVWWGGIVTLAYVGHYLIISGMLGLPMSSLAIMWAAFGVIAPAGYFLLMRTFPVDKPGQSSVGNRVSSDVWMAGGFVLFSLFAGLIIKSFLEGAASPGFAWSVPIVLGVYGMSQLVSGLMANNSALKTAGFIAIAFVGITVLLIDKPELWIAAAFAAALSVLVPGFMLMRNEPDTTV